MVMAEESATARRRLTRDDWAAEALNVLADGGLGAVAVEPIAERLGATKGSFYWHFANREELLRTALELWERRHTVEVNAAVDAASADPGEQLELLVRNAVGTVERDPTALTLLASADDPLVAPVLERVTRLRLDYLTLLFEHLGVPAELARWRAVLTYSAYLGHAQLTHSTPDVLPEGRPARRGYLRLVLETLAPEAGQRRS